MSTLGERMQDYRPMIKLRSDVTEKLVAELPEHLRALGRAFLDIGDTAGFDTIRNDPSLQVKPKD